MSISLETGTVKVCVQPPTLSAAAAVLEIPSYDMVTLLARDKVAARRGLSGFPVDPPSARW